MDFAVHGWYFLAYRTGDGSAGFVEGGRSEGVAQAVLGAFAGYRHHGDGDDCFRVNI